MARTREILFKIFYSSSFTFAFLILIAFVAVAPADKLYESYQRRRIVDIIIIAAAWVLTALVASFLYCTRLYTTRSTLRDIPKTHMPIEREDLPGRNVHRLVQETYARTAIIAYQAKPRAKRIEVEVTGAGERMLEISKQIKTHHHHHELTQEERTLLEPKWGAIMHPGWHSPASEDMSGLEYARVADELIDLIEAKAVSLAPGDPMMTPLGDETLPADLRVVDALTRPEGLGMRSYLAQLAELGVLPDSDLTDDFLSIYEQSRFSGKPMTSSEFETMMRLFAEFLRNMPPVEQDLMDFGFDLDEDDYADNLRKGKAPSQPTNGHVTHRQLQSSSSTISHSSNGSVVHNTADLPTNDPSSPPHFSPAASMDSLHTSSSSEAYTGTAYTARSALPTFTSASASASVSNQRLGSARPEYRRMLTRSTSGHASFHSAASGRSAASSSQASQGSVIRLVGAEAGNRDVGSGGTDLPYEIDVRGFAGR